MVVQMRLDVRDSLLEKEGWIRSGAALRWLEKSAQTGWAPKQLWYLFVLESWLQNERKTAVVAAEMESALVALGA